MPIKSLAFLLLSIATLASALSTSGRFIVDDNGKRYKLRCVNWAGHIEANIPEGLQHRTPDDIAAFLVQQKYNCVRLTYSIDMANNPNTLVSDSFNTASQLTSTGQSLVDVYNQAVSVNPWLQGATIQDAFSHVLDALHNNGLTAILDNQMNNPTFCCSQTDGNGWWDEAAGYTADNSRNFNTQNWLSGLTAMANYAKAHPAVVGMSVRNELRPAGSQGPPGSESDWYKFTTMGAQAIHGANPDLLITIGGISYANDLTFLYNNPLDTSSFAGKAVLEAHTYGYQGHDAYTDCDSYTKYLGDNFGFVLTQGQKYTAPLFLSEFGVAQTGGPNAGLSNDDHAYLTCLAKWLQGNDADWAYWALQGDYYVRNDNGKNTTNDPESYGIFNSDWSAASNGQFPQILGSMFDVTQGP